MTVSFGRHVEPTTLAGFLDRHRRVHAERLARDEQQHADALRSDHPDRYALATLEFGRTHEHAVLAWFDRLSALLDGGPTDTAGGPAGR